MKKNTVPSAPSGTPAGSAAGDRKSLVAHLTSALVHGFYEARLRYAPEEGEALLVGLTGSLRDLLSQGLQGDDNFLSRYLAEIMLPETRLCGTYDGDYCVGADNVMPLLVREHLGLGDHCQVHGEKYDILEVSPDVCLCTGQCDVRNTPKDEPQWTAQRRVTTLFVFREEGPRCLHLALSGPRIEPGGRMSGTPFNTDSKGQALLQRYIDMQRNRLSEEQEELASIFEEASCCILRLLRTRGGVYHLIRFNRALENITEMPSNQLVFLDWSRGIDHGILDADVEKATRALDDLRRPGDTTKVEYRYMDYGGKLHYLLSINSCISSDEKGTLIQRVLFDITDRAEREAALRRMSYEDGLTRLFNRTKFIRYLEAWYRKPSALLGVASLDVNGLKLTNDTLGHSAGDSLLRRTAAQLRRFFPDRVFRVGGDEFVIVEEEMPKDAFLSRLEDMRGALSRGGIRISLGASWRGADRDLEAQVEEADRRMYEDKHRFYSNPANDRRRLRRLLEEEAQQAHVVETKGRSA